MNNHTLDTIILAVATLFLGVRLGRASVEKSSWKKQLSAVTTFDVKMVGSTYERESWHLETEDGKEVRLYYEVLGGDGTLLLPDRAMWMDKRVPALNYPMPASAQVQFLTAPLSSQDGADDTTDEQEEEKK